MQSDHGHDTPSTGGHDRDEAAWLDLVARLQEPDDGFMDASVLGEKDGRGTEPDVRPEPDARPAEGLAPLDPGQGKGVDDFDPLGVWRRQLSPAPQEPGHGGDLHNANGPRDYEADDSADEFVPGELPSLAGSDPAIMLSWIGAAGGPILLVLAVIFWRGMPLLAVMAVVLAFLAGTGYLIYRLPKNRDHDGDDGAVV